MPRTRLLSIVMVALAGITALLMLVLVWRDGNRVIAGALTVLVVGLIGWLVFDLVRRNSGRR